MNSADPWALPEGEGLYVVRVWYERDQEHPVWRASLRLQDGSGLKYFASPEALYVFLDACFHRHGARRRA